MRKIISFMMDVTSRKLTPLVLVLLLQTFAGYGQTCDSSRCNCSTGDMNPSGIMVGHHHPKGRWMFSYNYMDMQMKGNFSGTHKVDDGVIFQQYIMSPQSMSMDMHMIMAMYGITNKLSAMIMFNYTSLSMHMNMLPGTMHMHMSGMADINSTNMACRTSGIGDTRVYGMYTLLNKKNHQLIFSTGLSVPTGNIELKGKNKDIMYAGQHLPYMMQLGSGTFDLMPGVTYLLIKPLFSWGTQVTGIIRPSYNAAGYCYGNELTVNTWLTRRFFYWLSASLRIEGCKIGNMYGRDPYLYEIMEPGSKPLNYGGEKANAYAGLIIYLKKIANSRLAVEYGLPFYQNTNGPQLALYTALHAGWTVSF